MLLEDYYEDHLIASLGRETNSILISLFMASYLYHEIKQIINQIVYEFYVNFKYEYDYENSADIEHKDRKKSIIFS